MDTRKDWLFTTDRFICDVRTAGVLIKNQKLLVQREKHGSEYALPGGHIQMGETLEEGLMREWKEETAAQIQCGRLLWTEECFWAWKGRKAHTLAFYYLIEEKKGFEIPDSGSFSSHKDNGDVLFGWLPVDRIREVTIYPAFLKEQIHRLDEPPKHFITKS